VVRGADPYYLVAKVDLDDLATLQAAFRSSQGQATASREKPRDDVQVRQGRCDGFIPHRPTSSPPAVVRAQVATASQRWGQSPLQVLADPPESFADIDEMVLGFVDGVLAEPGQISLGSGRIVVNTAPRPLVRL
jgi:hypothetical protein